MSRETKRSRMVLAAAVTAAALVAGCASGPPRTAYRDDGEGRVFTLAELERHIAEHVREADGAGLGAHAAAIGKANALARIARTLLSLPRRRAGGAAPLPVESGSSICYAHSGDRVGPCLDI